MKKRKLLLIGILIWNLNSVFGQVCGTPHPINPTVYPQEETNLHARGSSSALCIDVFFHVVRNTNGTNAFPLPNIDAIVGEMNEVYSPHDIVINNAGIDFIDNTDLLIIDTDNGEDNVLFSTQNQEEFINFYIVDSFIRTGLVGKAQNIPSRNLVMRENDVLTNVSAHELGHCLNLYHTHQPGGDMVADTPVDPGLGTHNVSATCLYTGGGGFNPLANNIMSYSRIACLTDFTNGQGFRMRYAIRNESVLQNIEGNSCTSISEVNNICYPQTSTITLSNLDEAITTWSTSNNVQIVSSNNSSAQIRALNSSSTGNGWIRAIISNGIEFTEEFEVGLPKTESISIHKAGSFKLYNNTWNWIHARYNGSYDYNIPNWEWRFFASQGVSVMTRNAYKSTIHVRPTADGTLDIQARVSNECGCSGWRSKVFQIGNGSGSTGTGPGLEW